MGPYTETPLLEMKGISKDFPGVRALDRVDFVLRRGEVHAVMGENGAGKSTLIKVLTGVYPRDAGEIRLDGAAVDPHSPKHAEALGISTVYQEVNLIPHLSVAENILLGRQPTRFGAISWRAIRKRARAAMARLGLDIDVSQEVSSYSVAIQQLVAIARALDVDAKLLVLDEPTSSLDEQETAELFTILRNLRGASMGIIFITHFIDQVYAVSDRITILRDGRLVGQFDAHSLPKLELVGNMIGKDPDQVAEMTSEKAGQPAEGGQVVLETRGLARTGSIAPIDVTISQGQVVGLAGLLGSGRTEIARLLFGVDKSDTGEVLIDGKSASIHSPRSAIGYRLALTPEDRKVAGIIPNLTVRENIILAIQASRGMWRTLPRQKQLEIANKFIAALNIKTPGTEQAVANLSGGNQQKVLLARWLATEPRLLILDEPTRGIDVGAKAEVEQLISKLCADGMAILFISSELEEVVRDSHRVVVLRDRRKVGELIGDDIEMHRIMGLIAGHESEG